MASSISWLDASSEEQKRMRELLGLFTEGDTREELGLGQIRDAVADGLFPGTSTLHTRARYLFFIPWIYQYVAQRRGTIIQARKQELAFITALKKSSPNEQGIIGSDAGSTLKTVPSSVYWSALGTYGILSDPNLSRERALALDGSQAGDVGGEPELDDIPVQKPQAWRSSLPEPPSGFPSHVPGGMQLTPEEAAWLQERFLESAPDTLLAHLAQHRPDKLSEAPWEDPVALTAIGPAKAFLEHAKRFAEVIHGAQLLYNLLLAESYEKEGLTRVTGRREHFTERLEAWAASFEEADWNVDEFFQAVTQVRGRPVATRSEQFVRKWDQLLKEVEPSAIGLDERARTLVQDRERQNKGGMARIGRRKRLETWGGSSGASQYTYRWSFVQAILRDMHDGLDRTLTEARPHV